MPRGAGPCQDDAPDAAVARRDVLSQREGVEAGRGGALAEAAAAAGGGVGEGVGE